MNNIPVFKDITKQEQFERNMKNVLEIEKKNAVKEFAEKLKKIVFEQGNPYNVPYEEFSQANVLFMVIDELLKEYEEWQKKRLKKNWSVAQE